jgi:hypothetical protein
VAAPREAGLVRSDRDARLILEVEVEVDADPIAGVVRHDPHDPGEAFIGWMGLTRAIELALERRNSEASSR